jgi:hypothetical protein
VYRSRVRLAAVIAVLGVLLCGCSGSSTVSGTPVAPSSPAATSTASAGPAAPTRQERYVAAVLADRPVGLWALTDVAGTKAGDAVVDSSSAARDALVVEGAIGTTAGPLGVVSGRFDGHGRIVTPVVGALRPGRPFTLEFFFRPDSCTRHWTQVVGTASYGARGREGVNLLHYPKFFPTGCRLAVEFWLHDRYTGGCGPPAVTRPGAWLHFAAAYDGRTVRCYAGGRPSGSSPVQGFGYVPTASFGIGGAGSGYAGTLDSGSLADVALYDRVLSPAAVLQHARAAA